MKSLFKSTLILILCLLMFVPLTAFTDVGKAVQKGDWISCGIFEQELDENGEVIFERHIQLSPEYASIASDSDGETTKLFFSIEEAAAYARELAVARENVIVFNVVLSFYDPDNSMTVSDFLPEYYEAFWTELFKHTGVPDEGDYLAWHYTSRSWSTKYKSSFDYATGYKSLDLTSTFKMNYYTTAEQEAAVTERVVEVLKSLDLDGKSNYEKIVAVHDWICINVSYDYANLGNSSYKLKQSAYAALINGTAVCQGYASLFYRMMTELGIDCRLISGQANNGFMWAGHAWDIVRIDGKYYNIDCTWDSTDKGFAIHWYFLDNTSSFTDSHIPEDDPTTPEFAAAYPMGEGKYDPNVNPHTHTPSAGMVGAYSPTCWEKGHTGNIICLECGDTLVKGEFISPLGHTPSSEKSGYIAPTCTSYGYTGDTVCATCGNILCRGESIPKAEHTPSEERVGVKEATCTEYGHTGRLVCAVCERVLDYGSNISPLGHAPASEPINVKEATCTEYGYSGDIVCERCDRIMYSGSSIAKVPHTPSDERVNVKDPTCTENGYTGDILCTVCGEIAEKGIIKRSLGHKSAPERVGVKEPTCTEKGYSGDTVCEVCGETLLLGHETPKVAHTVSDEKVNVKDPTCIEEGYSGDIVCEVCGEIRLEGYVISKLAHTPSEEMVNDKDPTCTGEGYTGDLLCKVCGEIVKMGETIPALGHDYKDGICQRCDEVCGHKNTELRDVIDVDCVSDGYSGDRYCVDCGLLTEQGEIITATGHKWDGDKCSVCGEPKPVLPLGDINGDGKVNVQDGVLMQRILAKLETNPVYLSRADLNGDGKINVQDGVKMQRILAHLE